MARLDGVSTPRRSGCRFRGRRPTGDRGVTIDAMTCPKKQGPSLHAWITCDRLVLVADVVMRCEDGPENPGTKWILLHDRGPASWPCQPASGRNGRRTASRQCSAEISERASDRPQITRRPIHPPRNGRCPDRRVPLSLPCNRADLRGE